MKKIKVSIKDENTLVLLEDAKQGDIVDLSSLHDVDIDKTTIENVVKSIKMDQFNAKLKEKTEALERENQLKIEAMQRENALNLSIKEKEIAQKVKDQVDKSKAWKKPVVTEIIDASAFWNAEDYHQDYLIKNPGGYTCHYVRDVKF